MQVSEALGPELIADMVFVGGCVTGLLVNDVFSQGEIRHTDDVDIITQVLDRAGFYRQQQLLSDKGFLPRPDKEAPICALWLGELQVDFMPDSEEILGFSNMWYTHAVKQAVRHELPNGLTINVASAPSFLGTKLEAYKGRGEEDPMGSRDIEDLITVVDGRSELLDEIKAADPELRSYIALAIEELLEMDDFTYAVQSATNMNKERDDILFHKLESIAAMKGQ